MPRRRPARLGFVACALWFAALPTLAQDVTLRAYLEPAGTIVDTRPVQLVVEVRGRDVPQVAVPRLPAMTNLQVLGGPSTQQSFSTDMVGGRMMQSVSKSLVWTLMPGSAGPAEIPPIEVRIGGDVRMTEAIRLSVATGSTGAPGSSDRGDVDNAPVFLDAKLSKAEVFIGEPLIYDVTLYSALTATNYDPVDGPNLSSFWAQQIEVDPTHESFERVIEGRRYRGYPVERRVLVPNAAGEFELAPVRARIGVQARRRDLLDQFFGRGTNVWRQTRPLQLTVKPLPEAGRPADFSGAVGEFRFEVSLDRDTATINDAVALRAKVSGQGFLKGVAAPTMESNADLKLFDPDVRESSRPDQGGLRSSKTWEWLLVPLTPGKLQVPRLTFTFFDPQAGSYRTLRNEPTLLTVERGDAQRDTPIARGDVRLQRRRA